MVLRPVEDYHSISAEAAAALLLATGDAELPDTKLTRARGEQLKKMAREFKVGLSPQERIYVAGFLENDALREWAQEERR